MLEATNITMANDTFNDRFDSEASDHTEELDNDRNDDLSDDQSGDQSGDQRDNSQETPLSSRGERKRSREQRHAGTEHGDRRDAITGTSDSASSEDHRTGYQFDFKNDVVTNLRRVRQGISRSESIEKGESWSFDGTTLIQTEQNRRGTEVSTYADNDGDSVFTRIGESFTPFAGGTPPLG